MRIPPPPVGTVDPMPRVHDPVVARDGRLFLFGTGRGVSLQTSDDGRLWTRQNGVLAEPPAWCEAEIPRSNGFFWAPEVIFFNSRWHLYYSVSTFGKNRSAIGLATNVTLDPDSPLRRWEDHGPIVQSRAGDDFNAIDPAVTFDEAGGLWLSFGSFWSGLKMIRLDAATGKVADGAELISLASRPRTPEIQGSVEAPFLVRRGGWFHLFASFDFCCRGLESTYNIRVGRARDICGPYFDRDGAAMLDGGGTLVRAGGGRWVACGHNSIFSEGGRDWLVYHAYDAREGGLSRLRIEELGWDEDGWPQVVERDENAPLPGVAGAST